MQTRSPNFHRAARISQQPAASPQSRLKGRLPCPLPGHRVARLQTALQNILGVTVIGNTLNKISIVFPKTITIFIP